MPNRRTIIKAICALCASAPLSACQNQKDKASSLRRVALGTLADFTAPTTSLPIQRLLIRRDSRGLTAMSLVCTHQTCLLTAPTIGNQDSTLHCPCHGSEFSELGRVLKGPANRDLPYFELEIDKEKKLWVFLGKEVSPDWRLVDDGFE